MEQQTNGTVNNNLIYGILCYLGFLWIIPLLVNKKNAFFPRIWRKDSLC